MDAGIQVFIHVAETRSFVEAGKQVGLSASAVGKSVSRLEKRMGSRLFHRNTRAVTLTAEGALFLVRARRIIAELEAAHAELARHGERPQGRLKIGLPLVGGHFVSMLADFRLAYPEIELDIDFADRKVDIIDEGYDAVIRSGELGDSRLSARKLGRFRMHLVGSPDYFGRKGIPSVPADLKGHDCIQFRLPETGKLQRWDIRQNDIAVEMTLPPSVICNGLDTRLQLALKGVGIAYLTDFATRDAVMQQRLVPVLAPYVYGEGSFQLVWPTNKNMPSRMRVFIDFVLEHNPLRG